MRSHKNAVGDLKAVIERRRMMRAVSAIASGGLPDQARDVEEEAAMKQAEEVGHVANDIPWCGLSGCYKVRAKPLDMEGRGKACPWGSLCTSRFPGLGTWPNHARRTTCGQVEDAP